MNWSFMEAPVHLYPISNIFTALYQFQLNPFNMNKIFAICFIHLCFSCNNPQEKKLNTSSNQTIEIETNNTQDTSNISNIIDSIKIIKIRETNEGMVGGIEKLFLLNNNYVIFDPFFSNRVAIYNQNGEFVKNPVTMGAGPKELSKLSDVWINDRGELEVYDNYLNKIQVFDQEMNPSTTTFIKNRKLFGSTVKLRSNPTKYISYAGYNGFYHNGSYFKLAILDSSFNIEKTFFKYNSMLNHALVPTPISPLYKKKNTIEFTQDFDPSIYSIDSSEKLEKKYTLNYLTDPFPEEFEKTLIEPNIQEFKSENINTQRSNEILGGHSGYRGPWLESEKYSYFTSFNQNGKPFFTIYGKEKQEILYQANSFIESEQFHIQIPPHFYTVDAKNNKFVAFYEGYITLMLLKESSPFYEMVKGDTESFYIIEVTFK